MPPVIFAGEPRRWRRSVRGLLQQVVDRFPGDPNAVEIDESIPGMEHMQMDHGQGSTAGMDHGMGH